MGRVGTALIAATACALLLLAAIGLILASVFLALSSVLAPWLAALMSALAAIVLAVLLMVVALTATRPRGRAGLATELTQRHPLGVAGAALTVGVLASSSDRTRALLVYGMDSYARLLQSGLR